MGFWTRLFCGISKSEEKEINKIMAQVSPDLRRPLSSLSPQEKAKFQNEVDDLFVKAQTKIASRTVTENLPELSLDDWVRETNMVVMGTLIEQHGLAYDAIEWLLQDHYQRKQKHRQ